MLTAFLSDPYTYNSSFFCFFVFMVVIVGIDQEETESSVYVGFCFCSDCVVFFWSYVGYVVLLWFF